MAKKRGKDTQDNIVLYLSTYPPRECGIATFTEDLTSAMDKRFNPATKSRVIALNDTTTSLYNYENKVLGQIAADNIEEYVSVAQKINGLDEVKLVNIQHEFGIFGGRWGDYLIPFLQVLHKPVVTTFHSVLPKPDEFLRRLVRLISERSVTVLVMNERSKKMLESDYGIPWPKILLVPHGIPQTTFDPSEPFKRELGLDGKIVLSTFGLLSGSKGIEYALRALTKVISRFPNIIYLIIGATHPVVRENEGERYRNFLLREARRLGLQDHVRFYNKYLTLPELIDHLKATDVYVSPTLNREQSVSGTISYALGCGRPVVSTATEYAKHIINSGNGRLVKFKNPPSFAQALLELIRDEKLVKSMGQGAYESTRHMTWPNVAAQHLKVYKKCVDIDAEEKKLPEVKLDHLTRLTDGFGILHHARYSRPERRFGYSLDDNARALMVCAQYYAKNPKDEVLKLMQTYLDFMRFMQRKNGTFARLANMQKRRDNVYDEDVLGRGVWALGYFLWSNPGTQGLLSQAEEMFRRAIKLTPKLNAPRAVAFAMAGLYYYLKRHPKAAVMNIFLKLANRELNFYKRSATYDWHWFEDRLTYSNSKLSESLFYAYDLTKDKKYLEIAEKTFGFLRGITFEKRYYVPIGQAGWYVRHKNRSYFDQQPEDASSMVQTKAVAYKVTGDKRHADDAIKAFHWFLGKNHLGIMVYDEVTGGCHDGLGQYAMNLNQGAESTISYLLARLALDIPQIKNEL